MKQNKESKLLSLVVDEFIYDEDLLIRNLKKLYEIVESDTIKLQIIDIFNKYDRCIECCGKLNNVYECPNCDKE